MNRADPFFERDATGWQFIDVNTGRAQRATSTCTTTRRAPLRSMRTTGQPQDMAYQDADKRIPPQTHYLSRSSLRDDPRETT